MSHEKLEFPGYAGDLLAARLDLPEGEPRAFALFAHCFTCGKDMIAVSRVSNELNRRGIAVLRFDFTGLGASGGDFASSNFSSNVDDLVLAADFLRENYSPADMLIGHSLGGAAVLAAAHRIPDARAVVTIGAPADPVHVQKQFDAQVCDIRDQGEMQVQLAGRPFTIRKQFLDDLEANPLTERVKHLGKPLLIMHSPIDKVVDVDNARLLYQEARHPKSYVSLDTADHLLLQPADAFYAADVLAAWVNRYLPEPSYVG